MEFHCFQRLPVHIRSRIWAECLPREESVAVFVYRNWKWAPRPINDSSQPSQLVDNNGIVTPHVEVMAPIVFVNRQARAEALQWARRHGFELSIYHREGANQRAVIRQWDPCRDTLYVSCERWDEFWQQACHYDKENLSRLWFFSSYPHHSRSYTLGRSHSSDAWVVRPSPFNAYITSLALPSDILTCDMDYAAALVSCMPNLRTLFVIFDSVPEMTGAYDSRRLVHPRLEVAKLYASGSDNIVVREYAYADRPWVGMYKIYDLDTQALENRIAELDHSMRKNIRNTSWRRAFSASSRPRSPPRRNLELALPILQPAKLKEVGAGSS